ncbi:YkyA family protein [Bacillus thuringiensis]|uniref:YkyA family protein n=1 Tax=Bacillus thuringiensis TaxID=1428 RepID=UPI000CF96452|nr:YkyA family protein [Bacillus thuringiensis]PQQ47323.1 hypothetical protein C6A34_12515 [Bacillus thuringiensis]
MKIKKMLMVGILMVGILSGCIGHNPENQLYTTFENTMSQEKLLVNDKKKLEELEKKGQELYSQILQDGKENNGSVTGKIDQAMTNIDEREKIINKEKDLLETEQKKIQSSQSYIDKIKEDAVKKQANKVKESYGKRYQSFTKINKNYVNMLKEEKQLLEKLKIKETNLKEITEKVNVINGLNDEIQKEKENFNINTKEYNEGKLSFYKDANIQVKEEK